MLDAGQPVPGEEEQADEGRFEEEGHQPFDRQRRAEHIADIMRVIGPVGAELEFHGDAGGDAHGEIDAEQHAPEFHHVAPDRLAGHHIDGFHDAEQDGKPQRQRHEDEMIKRGNRELQAGKLDDIHCRPSVSAAVKEIGSHRAAVGFGRIAGSDNRVVD